MSNLILFGVIQGFLMSTLLWFKKSNQEANKFLALTIIAISLSMLRIWTHYTGLWWNPFFHRLPLAFDLAMGPFLYAFTLALTHESAEKQSKVKFWLIPWAIFFFYSFIVYLLGLGAGTIEDADRIAHRMQFNSIKSIEDATTVVLNIILIYLSWQQIKRHTDAIENWVSDELSSRLNIMKIATTILFILMIGSALDFVSSNILNLADDTSIVRKAFYLGAIVVIYGFGLIGYRLPQIPDFNLYSAIEPKPKSDLNNAKNLFKKIEAAMDKDQLYLNPALSLLDVAKAIDHPSQKTSQLIKENVGLHFRDYVNAKRIERVKLKLKDPELAHFSVLAIALDSGFNSEASFYRHFKKAMGMSPSKFRKA